MAAMLESIRSDSATLAAILRAPTELGKRAPLVEADAADESEHSSQRRRVAHEREMEERAMALKERAMAVEEEVARRETKLAEIQILQLRLQLAAMTKKPDEQ
jgi:hypothetical protein